MKLLISPSSVAEARLVAEAGCDIVDVKNVAEGSLGAQPPWVIQQIINELGQVGATISVAIGDLPNQPGTIGLAAYGAAQLGPHYIKAGLYAATNQAQAYVMMSSVVKSIRMVSNNIIIVAAGYADFRRFGGVGTVDLIRAAADSGADVVMVDTYFKDGRNLFDAMRADELHRFVDQSHAMGMQVALAGSIGEAHLDQLMQIKPDIIGIRGAVCMDSDRTKSICVDRIRQLASRLCDVQTGIDVPNAR